MKFSLCNEVIADRPFEEQCVFAASLGYDGLEIAPFTLGDDPRLLSERDIARTLKSLKDAGIVATGLHWLLIKPENLSITTPDSAVRKDTIEVLIRNVELCAELGGTVLVHGSPKQRSFDLNVDPEGSIERALDVFRLVAEKAEAVGVTYCLEPLHAGETHFINRVEEAVEIVNAVNSPAFKTMIDTSSAAKAEKVSVSDAIRQWMPTGHIAHIQFNDSNRRAAGQGDDKFYPILRALKDTNYNGVIAMEPFIYEPDPSGCAAFTLGYVKGVMENL